MKPISVTGMHMGRMMHGGGGVYRGRQQGTNYDETATLLDVPDNSTVAMENTDELIPQDQSLVIVHPELPVLWVINEI